MKGKGRSLLRQQGRACRWQSSPAGRAEEPGGRASALASALILSGVLGWAPPAWGGSGRSLPRGVFCRCVGWFLSVNYERHINVAAIQNKPLREALMSVLPRCLFFFRPVRAAAKRVEQVVTCVGPGKQSLSRAEPHQVQLEIPASFLLQNQLYSHRCFFQQS